jgi:Uma2 family endonuclease
VSAGRRDEVLTDQHMQGAPDLVVEIGSPSTPLLPGLNLSLSMIFEE